MDSFDCFSPDVRRFFKALRANNTKDWFTSNKATYEACIKEPSKQFAKDMEIELQALTGLCHGSKIFRINRDLRFSKDKTPYNTHLHLAFTPVEQDGQPPMWFFGLSPEKVSLGCGVFQYGKAALQSFRNAMAGPKGLELMRLGADLRADGVRISETELIRVPPEFESSHPNSEALRRKGFSAWLEKDGMGFATQPNLVARVANEWRTLLPVFRLLLSIDK